MLLHVAYYERENKGDKNWDVDHIRVYDLEKIQNTIFHRRYVTSCSVLVIIFKHRFVSHISCVQERKVCYYK